MWYWQVAIAHDHLPTHNELTLLLLLSVAFNCFLSFPPQPMSDPSMAICLTPQGFYNLPIKEGKKKDIFNSLNLAFWEYMLPGEPGTDCCSLTGGSVAV